MGSSLGGHGLMNDVMKELEELNNSLRANVNVDWESVSASEEFESLTDKSQGIINKINLLFF